MLILINVSAKSQLRHLIGREYINDCELNAASTNAVGGSVDSSDTGDDCGHASKTTTDARCHGDQPLGEQPKRDTHRQQHPRLPARPQHHHRDRHHHHDHHHQQHDRRQVEKQQRHRVHSTVTTTMTTTTTAESASELSISDDIVDYADTDALALDAVLGHEGRGSASYGKTASKDEDTLKDLTLTLETPATEVDSQLQPSPPHVSKLNS